MIGTEKIKSFQHKFICIVTDEAFFPEKNTYVSGTYKRFDKSLTQVQKDLHKIV